MRIRVKFEKHGYMKYIGHLDVMRAFQKMNRRAGIPIAYTEGFSPHQKLSFAQPLSVGTESEAEYADMELKEERDPGELIRQFNYVAPEGIRVTGITVLPGEAKNAMASVRSASYLVSFKEEACPGFDPEKAVKAYLCADRLVVTKETKKGLKEVDLKKGIREISRKDNALFMRVDAGSENNIKPSLVVKALFSLLDLQEPAPGACLITRLELYGEDGRPLGEPADSECVSL